jgi:hypothetical protein
MELEIDHICIRCSHGLVVTDAQEAVTGRQRWEQDQQGGGWICSGLGRAPQV